MPLLIGRFHGSISLFDCERCLSRRFHDAMYSGPVVRVGPGLGGVGDSTSALSPVAHGQFRVPRCAPFKQRAHVVSNCKCRDDAGRGICCTGESYPDGLGSGRGGLRILRVASPCRSVRPLCWQSRGRQIPNGLWRGAPSWLPTRVSFAGSGAVSSPSCCVRLW